MTPSKAGLALLGVSVLAVLDPAAAGADKAHRGWSGFVGPHGTSDRAVLGSGGASSVSSPFFVGVRVWQRLGELAAAEAELPVGLTNSRDQVATIFMTMPRLQARYFPLGVSRVTPSVVLGAGLPIVTSTKQSSVNSDIGVAAYVGAGADLRHKNFRVGIEGRYFATPAHNDASSPLAHEWELLLNLGWAPGGNVAKPVVAEPLPDTDGDGVVDAKDDCPSRAEDEDGFEDEDGCPELDNDGDGVIDGLDECSREAEDFNGFEDDDGCSDEVPGEVRLLEGVVTGLRFDAGSGVMDDAGQEELVRLAGILRDFPSVKVELIGHSDDQEAAPAELHALSVERAESVRQLFVEMGIGHGRVFSFGRADKEPFDSNSTARGRRANRRVELRLLRGEPSQERSIEELPDSELTPVGEEPAKPESAIEPPAAPEPAAETPAADQD